jgi:hypothetical protein
MPRLCNFLNAPITDSGRNLPERFTAKADKKFKKNEKLARRDAALPCKARQEGDLAMLSVYCSPGRYAQGRGATAAPGLEGPARIVASKTVIGRLAETGKSSLDEVKLHHVVHAPDSGSHLTGPGTGGPLR